MAEDNLPFTDLEAHIVSEVHQWLGEQGTEFSLSGLFGTFVSSIKERLGAPKVPRMFPTNNCETAIRAFILARLEAVRLQVGEVVTAPAQRCAHCVVRRQRLCNDVPAPENVVEVF